MKKTWFLLLSFLLLLLVDDVKAQLKLGDQPTSVQKSVILDLQGSNGRQGVWLPRISDTTDATGIDALNPPDGVMIYHTSGAQVMIRRNGYWNSLQTTTKVGSTTSSHSVIEFQLGTAAGASKDFNMTLDNVTGVITLNIPDAAVDTRGVVTIGSQAFGGLKTFNDGLTSLSTTTVSGASSNASNLYLGITSATTPGTTTDRFLSVDNSGRVVLLQGIPSTRTMTINGTTYDLSANRTWNVGTMTSVTGGYGLSGGTITSSGTFAVDTFSISTRGWRQKGIDSIAAIMGASSVPLTRTLNGLALSSNQTFATGTSGTDFGISSSGTTHTFNIPTASSTARGLLSAVDWTTFNNKVSASRTLTINGTGYDLSADRTWNVGTVTSVANGYGLNGGTITTTGTHSVDTFSISTRVWRQKGIDSVTGLLNAYIPATRTLNGLALSSNQTFAVGTSGTDFNIISSGTTHTFNIPTASSSNRGLLSSADWTTFNNKGTVSSIGAGYGISGGTITSTGTHSVDTFSVSTRAWRQKGIDSVAGLLNAYIPATRTLNGLALSSNQTFTVGTSGTDFNISSSGTVHTFNIPDASSTARGVVTTGDQSFDGIKTFVDPVSAKVNLQAGTATAGTAPLKFTSGTNLTTPENGAMEYNGTNYFVTSGGTRYTMAKTLTNTAALDFPNTATVSTSTLTITVTGAADGDVVTLGVPSGSMNANCAYIAYVSSANTVTVAFINYSTGSVNPASGTFRVAVLKY
jgi:predicted heme/steroid binding protein